MADAWIDDLAEGVVLTGNGVVTRINAAAGEILGVDPAWAVGRRLISVVRDHRLEAAVLGGREVEIFLRSRLIQAVPIDGGVALRDVSEARGAREDTRNLLAVLSHELRTPMTTVRSTLEALNFSDLGAEERGRLLGRAIQEADRVVRLLDDLTVDVAPPRERSVDLAAAVERACAILEPTLKEQGVKVRHSLTGLTVWVDPDKLLQVLINLIENSALHGPHDSVVDVVAEVRGGWSLLMVRDRGLPLPPSTLAKTFKPFQQSAAAKGGTRLGLGLYIVSSIVEQWGGRAWGRRWRDDDESGAGEGNEFGVLVPLTRESGRQLPPSPI